MKNFFLIFIVLIVLVSLVSCKVANENSLIEDIDANDITDYWPTEGWKTETPESQGMDSQKLCDAIDYINAKDMGIHSMIIIRNGYIVSETYFAPYKKESLHDIASISKSITSTLMGIAIDKEYVESVDVTLGSIFPDTNDNKKDVTIKDLLTMQTGFKLSGSEMTDIFNMIITDNWQEYILNLETNESNQFEYTNYAPYLTSAIINKYTQMDTLLFADKYLFSPLGIKDYELSVEPNLKNMVGYGEMRLKTKDLAKIGLLFLNDGKWEDTQIISKKWVKEATSKHVDIKQLKRPETNGYGYYWWLDEKGCFSARGREGQRLEVFPEENLIIAINSSSDVGFYETYNNLNYLYSQYILSSIVSDEAIDENVESYSLLQNKEEQSEIFENDVINKVIFTENLDEKYLGITYQFDANAMGIKALEISKENDNKYIIKVFLKPYGAEEEMVIYIDKNGKSLYGLGRNEIDLFSHMISMNSDRIKVHVNELGNIDNWNVLLNFYESGIKAEFTNTLVEGKDAVIMGRAIN